MFGRYCFRCACTCDADPTAGVWQQVLLVPGNPFMPDDSVSQYARASFSIATPDKMDEAFARLATLLRTEVEAQEAAVDGAHSTET